MRRVTLPRPPPALIGTAEGKFVLGALQEIARASVESDPALIASDFTLENYTETRTLDAATATATDIANVLCTLISDLAKGGSKKG